MMKLAIYPSVLEGVISAPPSKSATHRVLFLGLLSHGETRLNCPLVSRDTKASMLVIKAFGAKANWNRIRSSGIPTEPNNILYCSRSATTMRFATAIASLIDGLTILTGDRQLRNRPMRPIIKSLRDLGAIIYSKSGYPPIVVLGGKRANTNMVMVDCSMSSQFLSALLLISPFIGVDIVAKGICRSRPYIDLTISLMEKFGVKVERDGYRIFSVEKREYSARDINIPGDYTLASSFLVAGVLFGKIRVNKLSGEFADGGKKIIDILRQMEAYVYEGPGYIETRTSMLRGVEIDCSDIPDLFPILAVLGAYAEGKTRISGAEHLRYKESDRISTMATNLSKMGVRLRQNRDGLVIYGGKKLRGAILDSKRDHRVAMALTIASIGAEDKSVILGAEYIGDSYPSFLNDLSKLGCEMEVIK
jgi:3-phosphoshikimate 1-carboxyvinyltransferase